MVEDYMKITISICIYLYICIPHKKVSAYLMLNNNKVFYNILKFYFSTRTFKTTGII